MRQVSISAVIALLIVSATAKTDVQSSVEVASPDGETKVRIDFPTGSKSVQYAVTRKGEAVIAPSALGLDLAEPASFGPLALVNSDRRTVDTSYPLVVGKASSARDNFNEAMLTFQETSASKRRLNIVFRAYNDGVAFRYIIPNQPTMEKVSISGERTEFSFAGDYQCWGFNPGRTDTPHEGEYDPIRASRLRSHYLYDVPLVCRTSLGTTSLAIAEADLQDYGALYLTGRLDGGPGVTARLAMRHDLPEVAVMRQMTSTGIRSPWRVLMMADRMGQLIPSNLIANLNPPSMIKDTSWIKPGKAAWYWFTGDFAPKGGRAGMNMPTLEHYIDFAGRNGFEYMLIDIGWSWGSDITGGNWAAFAESLLQKKPQKSDLTRSEPRLDVPALVERAHKQGVGLIVWVHWEALDRQIDAAFSQFENWGLKGVKVDFMNRADQQIVAFYHRVLRKAAEHKLLIDFHSSYHPTGLNRTWPNLITQEGVQGSEWNVISKRVTATHNVTLPYTRMLLGPMDYTPGIFTNVASEEFVATDVNTQAMYTRAQSLAMYVVYDSPLQMLADTPEDYEGAAGFEFLKTVPTSWDETRFIAGDIGESIVLARRKGRDWYIGAMTNEEARTIDVPLHFLGPEKFVATIWADGDNPTALVKSEVKGLAAEGRLALKLARSGGAAVRLSPGK